MGSMAMPLDMMMLAVITANIIISEFISLDITHIRKSFNLLMDDTNEQKAEVPLIPIFQQIYRKLNF
jgi:hypothetical protein